MHMYKDTYMKGDVMQRRVYANIEKLHPCNTNNGSAPLLILTNSKYRSVIHRVSSLSVFRSEHIRPHRVQSGSFQEEGEKIYYLSVLMDGKSR